MEEALRRVLIAGGIVAAYGAIVVFAGHGAGPVAVLLVRGASSEWLSGQVLGWAGVILSLSALFARSTPAYVGLRCWGASLLVLSAGAFLSHGEALVLSAATAIPLLGAWLYVTWRHVAVSRARPSAPLETRPRQVTWAVVALGATLAVDVVFLARALTRGDGSALDALSVLQLVGVAVCAVLTWRGQDWARWGLVVLLVAPRVYFAADLLDALRQPSASAIVTGGLLLVDVAVLGLLLSRPASAWLRGRAAAPGA